MYSLQGLVFLVERNSVDMRPSRGTNTLQDVYSPILRLIESIWGANEKDRIPDETTLTVLSSPHDSISSTCCSVRSRSALDPVYTPSASNDSQAPAGEGRSTPAVPHEQTGLGCKRDRSSRLSR